MQINKKVKRIKRIILMKKRKKKRKKMKMKMQI
jgi:hypothetical protein